MTAAATAPRRPRRAPSRRRRRRPRPWCRPPPSRPRRPRPCRPRRRRPRPPPRPRRRRPRRRRARRPPRRPPRRRPPRPSGALADGGPAPPEIRVAPGGTGRMRRYPPAHVRLQRGDHRRVPGQRRQGRRPVRGGAVAAAAQHGGPLGRGCATNPVCTRPDGDGLAVFGSKAGAPTTPTGTTTWWPSRRHRRGRHRDGRSARVAGGDERERLWAGRKRLIPASPTTRPRRRARSPS